MSTPEKDPQQLARLLATALLSKARRELDLYTEGGDHDPVVWSQRLRYFKPFGLLVAAEQTLTGVLRVRDLETDEILVQSMPHEFDVIDANAPMVEEAVKAWAAERARQRREPIVTEGDSQ